MYKGLPGQAVADLRAFWRQLLAFHLLMQLLGTAIVVPLVTWAGRRILLAAGAPVISNFDIASFLLSPVGVVLVLAVTALMLALLLAELAGLSHIAGHAIDRRHVTAVATIAFVLRTLPPLMLLSARVFLKLCLLAIPFVAAAGLAWYTLLRGHDINYYLAEQPPAWLRARTIALTLVGAYVLLAAWQLARWLYAVPILAFEGAGPGRALEASARMTRGRLARIVTPLVAWWLLVTAAAAAITWAGRHVSDAGLDWAGIEVHRVLPVVAVCLAATLVGGFLYGGLNLAGHQFIVTHLYAAQRELPRPLVPSSLSTGEERSRAIARPAIAGTLALLAVALGTAAFLALQLDLEEDVDITAHRGAKVVAPENSLAAFRAAMDAGATYAELDVQLSRDRRIVVIHDGDLMRMAGDPRKVNELDAAELATIDIGRKFGEQFRGEHVPTLEEVIDLVRGRMKLNVELKYNVPDPGLAPAVVDLLRREGCIDQAVVTSLDYAALKQVESLEPRIRTGHIVTAAIGNVLRTEADFLSLNTARATASLVRRAHAAGKDVHVWTVNRPDVMLRMIERGVDNVITDDPALLVRVMRERRALGTAEILGLRLRVLFSRPPSELTDPTSVAAL